MGNAAAGDAPAEATIGRYDPTLSNNWGIASFGDASVSAGWVSAIAAAMPTSATPLAGVASGALARPSLDVVRRSAVLQSGADQRTPTERGEATATPAAFQRLSLGRE